MIWRLGPSKIVSGKEGCRAVDFAVEDESKAESTCNDIFPNCGNNTPIQERPKWSKRLGQNRLWNQDTPGHFIAVGSW